MTRQCSNLLLPMLVTATLVSCGGPPARSPTATESRPAPVERCNQSGRTILGTWAEPIVRIEDRHGNLSPAPRWQAELWLSERTLDDRCTYSCASMYLARVGTAPSPGAFVKIVDTGARHRRLRFADATLDVVGEGVLRQLSMRMDDDPPLQVDAYFWAYTLAFPPPGRAWQQLVVRVPFEDGNGGVRVEFRRRG